MGWENASIGTSLPYTECALIDLSHCFCSAPDNVPRCDHAYALVRNRVMLPLRFLSCVLTARAIARDEAFPDEGRSLDLIREINCCKRLSAPDNAR